MWRQKCTFMGLRLTAQCVLRSIVGKSDNLCRKCANALESFDMFYVPLLSKWEKILIGKQAKEIWKRKTD